MSPVASDLTLPRQVAGPHPWHASRRARPRTLGNDDAAVSEVIGFLVTFAIISLVLMLSMMAFAKASADARTNAIDLRAQSVGTRVANLAITAALTAEQHGAGTAVRFLADLPQQLEGEQYRIYLEPAAPGQVERVRVQVPSVGIEVISPLFSADASPTLFICGGASGTSAAGGRLYISFNTGSYPTQNCLFIEAAP